MSKDRVRGCEVLQTLNNRALAGGGFMGADAQWRGSDGVVKSGARVLDVFDYLYHLQRPAREVEIRIALSLPKSSTNDLLKTMVTRGYLAFSVLDRTYSPSYRLARFGNSVDSVDPGGHGLSSLIARLRSAVGEAVILAEPQEISMQIVAMETDDDEARRSFPEGRLIDIVSSATGRAYLMTRSEEDVRWIAQRNARLRPTERTTDALDSLMGMVREFSRVSYASAAQHLVSGPSLTVAMPLPPRPNRAPLMLAVGGAAQRMQPRVDQITVTMRRLITEHFSAALTQ
jgi:DNA-binding IclR family transcriptional regulator